MNLRTSFASRALTLACLLFSLLIFSSLINAQNLPGVIYENEGSFLGTWTLANGQYNASWLEALGYATAVLTVPSFTAQNVTINRTDTSQSVSAGLTAVYTGTISGANTITGSVTWTWPGHAGYPATGKWTAGWLPTQFMISTIAGTGSAGSLGDGGSALQAEFNDPRGVAVDSAGNVYVADLANNRVQKVTPAGIVTTVAGTGKSGFGGDGGPAESALLDGPIRVTVDPAGNLYIADGGNNRVRMVSTSGIINTVAGNGTATTSGDGGQAIQAGITGADALALDSAGNLYISQNIGYIRKVDTTGIITTIAGDGTFNFSGDGGPATKAQFNNINGLTVDSTGSIYVSDQNNNRIRKISGGTITTIVGNGNAGYAGDGGLGTKASINSPVGTSLDGSGNLYIADGNNNRIRVLLNSGIILTVAGTGAAGFLGDGGPALSAKLNNPKTVALTSAGGFVFADNVNNRIRLLTPAQQPPSVPAANLISAGAFGAFMNVSPGSWIEIYGSSLASDTRGWAASDFNGNSAPISLDGTSITIGGKSAFIDYISPSQVNALVSSDTPTGQQEMIVTNSAGLSAPYTVTVNTMEPGFLAPSSFSIGGTQYIVALFSNGTYALPAGSIAGLTTRAANPGDIITLYGIGFGPVTPLSPAGQIVQQANSLASAFQISIGGVPVTPSYAGLAPSFTGLYQFNIQIPQVPSGNAALTFGLAGTPGTQVLYIPIQ